jgi:hypothetical protein
MMRSRYYAAQCCQERMCSNHPHGLVIGEGYRASPRRLRAPKEGAYPADAVILMSEHDILIPGRALHQGSDRKREPSIAERCEAEMK